MNYSMSILRGSIWLVVDLSLIPAVKAAPSAETDQLIRQLGSDNYKDRETATNALEQLGESALPALREAGLHKDAENRRRATHLEAIEPRLFREIRLFKDDATEVGLGG